MGSLTEFHVHPLVVEATRESLTLLRRLRETTDEIRNERSALEQTLDGLKRIESDREASLATELAYPDEIDPEFSFENRLRDAYGRAESDLDYWYKTLPGAADELEQSVSRIREMLTKAGLAAEKDAAALLARIQSPEAFLGYFPQAWETPTALHLTESVVRLLRDGAKTPLPVFGRGEPKPWEIRRAINDALRIAQLIGERVGFGEELARLETEISRDFAELDRLQSLAPGMSNSVGSVAKSEGRTAHSPEAFPETSQSETGNMWQHDASRYYLTLSLYANSAARLVSLAQENNAETFSLELAGMESASSVYAELYPGLIPFEQLDVLENIGKQIEVYRVAAPAEAVAFGPALLGLCWSSRVLDCVLDELIPAIAGAVGCPPMVHWYRGPVGREEWTKQRGLVVPQFADVRRAVLSKFADLPKQLPRALAGLAKENAIVARDLSLAFSRTATVSAPAIAPAAAPERPALAGGVAENSSHQVTEFPDGPFGLDQFRWKERDFTLIGGIPFALLKAVWGKKNRILDRDDIAEAHGDRNDPPGWNAVKGNFGRMNKRMEAVELPFRFKGESRAFCVVLKHDPE